MPVTLVSPTKPQYDALTQAAIRLEGRTAQVFVDAVNSIRNQISLQDIEDALRTRDANLVLVKLGIDDKFKSVLNTGFREMIHEIFLSGVDKSKKDLNAVISLKKYDPSEPRDEHGRWNFSHLTDFKYVIHPTKGTKLFPAWEYHAEHLPSGRPFDHSPKGIYSIDRASKRVSVTHFNSISHSELNSLEGEISRHHTQFPLRFIHEYDVRKAKVTASFDLTNTKSIKALEDYTFNLIQGLTDESKEAIRQIIIQAFKDGGSPADQARKIREVIGLTPMQEQAITNYRTALETGGAKNLKDALSRSLRDGRYDPALITAIQSGSGLSKDRIDNMVGRYSQRYLAYRSQTIARTECLTGDTLVSGAMIRAALRRWYEGPVIEFVTSNGRKFTTTPNHPMLTQRGWIAANLLTKTDYLICNALQNNAQLGGNFNENTPPTPIAKVFDSLLSERVIERQTTSKIDFHGDGIDGYVDVKMTDRILPFGMFTSLNKPIIDQVLTKANLTDFHFCNFCLGLFAINKSVCFCYRAEFYSRIFQILLNRTRLRVKGNLKFFERFTSKIPLSNLFDRQVASSGGMYKSVFEFSPAGVRHTTQKSGGNKSTAYSIRRKSMVSLGESFGNTPATEPLFVELDAIVSISLRKYVGHVYNLETPFGYFTVDGVYTGNTIRASQAGQDALWQQAVEQGHLPTNVLRKWVASEDSRTCPVCRDLDGETAELGEEFLPGILHPPAHPACRCGLSIQMPEEGDEEL